MNEKIIISLLNMIGIRECTANDFERLARTLRLEKLNKRTKLMLWIALPALSQYVQYLLNPDESPQEQL